MQRFKNILVVGSEGPAFADLLHRAADLARRNDAEMTILGVVESSRSDRRVIMHDGSEFDVNRFLVQTLRSELQEVADGIEDVDVTVAVTTGTGFVEVIRAVIELGHDLVMVNPDPARRRLAGSSMAMHLLRKCPVPVWVESGVDGLESDVAVAVGPFSSSEDHARMNANLVQLGGSLAAIRGGGLHVIHAWRFEGESLLRRGRMRPPADEIDMMVAETYRRSEVALKNLLDEAPDFGVPVTVHLEKGEPGAVVPAILDEYRPGVIVMGTLARAGLQGVFMGNTAERVLGNTVASVLAVKPEGFTSPVAV